MTSLSLLKNIETGEVCDMICKVSNSSKYASTTHSQASGEHKLKDTFFLGYNTGSSCVWIFWRRMGVFYMGRNWCPSYSFSNKV